MNLARKLKDWEVTRPKFLWNEPFTSLFFKGQIISLGSIGRGLWRILDSLDLQIQKLAFEKIDLESLFLECQAQEKRGQSGPSYTPFINRGNHTIRAMITAGIVGLIFFPFLFNYIS